MMSSANDNKGFIRGHTVQHPHLRQRRKREADSDDDDEKRGNAAADVLFRSAAVVAKYKKAKTVKHHTHRHGNGDAAAGAGGGGGGDEYQRNGRREFKRVAMLTFKSLEVGTMLLGSVCAVNELDITVNLPHGLRGFVSLREVSDIIGAMVDEYLENDDDDDDDDGDHLPKLASMFRVGDIVRCVVIKLEGVRGRKRIELSMRPSLLNKHLDNKIVRSGCSLWASIRSKEEHGYMIDMGVSGTATGFMRFDEDAAAGERKWVTGQPLECAVVSMKGRVAQITSAPDALAKARIHRNVALSMEQLKPGMLVKCSVLKCVSNGVKVMVMRLFEGTIDYNHLSQPITATVSPADAYKPGQKLKARILYVNPASKRIGLTLKPHLMSLRSSSDDIDIVSRGDRVDDAVVLRCDEGVGLVLRMNESGLLAYSHISTVSDEKVKSLTDSFPPSSTHACRVVSKNYLDGVVNVSLQPSVLQQPFMSYNDIQPGMIVKGRIMTVNEQFGILLELAPRVKALCPLLHLGDVRVKKPMKRFKVDAQLRVRVLSVDQTKRKCIVTNKKTLVKSELPVLASYADAQVNGVYDGFVAAIQPYGVIIEFYNGVHGIVTTQSLQRAGVESVSDAYQKGQVIRCRVVDYSAADGRMRLSIELKPKKMVRMYADVEPGTMAYGVVVNPNHNDEYTHVHSRVCGRLERALLIRIGDDDDDAVSYACLDATQTTDHPQLANELYDAYLAEAVHSSSGIAATRIHMMLMHYDKANRPFMTAKPSLIAGVHDDAYDVHVPKQIDDVVVGLRCQGYVRNVTDRGVFVGFLNGLCGLATKNDLADHFVADPAGHFIIGQSTTARVQDVDTKRNRFMITLKPSSVAQPSSSAYDTENGDFLSSYFTDRQRIFELTTRYSPDQVANPIEWSRYPYALGANIPMAVQMQKSSVLLLDVTPSGHDDDSSDDGVVALALIPAHIPTPDTKYEVNQQVIGRLLDVDRVRRIYDVTLKPSLVSSTNKQKKKKKSKRKKSLDNAVSVGDRVDMVVQLVKKDYIVVSIPKHNNTIAYASTASFNIQVSSHAVFSQGQRCSGVVHALNHHGRCIVVVNMSDILSDHTLAHNNAAVSTTKLDGVKRGTLLTATVQRVCDADLYIVLSSSATTASSCELRMQIADVGDDFANAINAFNGFHKRIGDEVRVRVLDVVKPTTAPTDGKPVIIVNVSMRASDINNDASARASATIRSLQVGNVCNAFVRGVNEEHGFLWVAISARVYGRIRATQVSRDRDIQSNLAQHFTIGQHVTAKVTKINTKKSRVFLSMTALLAREHDKPPAVVDDVMTATVSRVIPNTGVTVELVDSMFGFIHMLDLSDEWPNNMVAKLRQGDTIKCRVLRVVKHSANTVDDDDNDDDSGKWQVALSSRASVVNPRMEYTPVDGDVRGVGVNTIKQGDLIRGIIKDTGSNGCFIWISHDIIGRCMLRNLSDKYVRDYANVYKPGTTVVGRVISVDYDTKRVDVSFKLSDVDPDTVKRSLKYEQLQVGDVYRGYVKNTAKFGVYVTLAHSLDELTGLCHVSEITGGRIKDVSAMFTKKQRVRVKIIKLDPTKKQMSFTMKPDAFDDDDDEGDSSSSSEDDSDDDAVMVDVTTAKTPPTVAAAIVDESVPELQLDDSSDDDNDGSSSDTDVEDATSTTAAAVEDGSDASGGDGGGKKRRASQKSRSSKRAKREREERKLEERELELMDDSRVAIEPSDFDRLLIERPNDSLVWVKYMAYYVDSGNIDMARGIGERALKTITIDEQQGRWNIWIALLNLENMHGTEATLKRVFDRAITYNNAKHVYLEMCKIYQNTQKFEDANNIMKIALKKFSGSAKVWIANGFLAFECGNADNAHMILKRACERLAKHKHVKVITQFARMEYKQLEHGGSVERGRSIFERVTSTYPKRTDLWSMYIDMELSMAKNATDQSAVFTHIRRIFERVVNMKLSTKRIQTFYKRYLKFEEQYGDARTVEHVKSSAKEYVQSVLNR